MRVQIPAYTDRWMMGDRYGEVLRLAKRNPKLGTPSAVLVVLLDRSGKEIEVIEDDCVYV